MYIPHTRHTFRDVYLINDVAVGASTEASALLDSFRYRVLRKLHLSSEDLVIGKVYSP